MSGLGNKKIFARNLAYYVERSGKTQKELAEYVGVATSTFNNWMKGLKYPRIDKIELLADYFHVMKSDLIEDKEEMRKKNDTLTDIVIRLRTDSDFLSAVKALDELDAKKLAIAKQTILAFLK